MKRQRMTGIIPGLVGVITLSILGLIGCQGFDRNSPTGSGTVTELAGYAQMDDGSVVVEGQQLNWVISDWGALPYEEWMYVEVNQQDAQGAEPGEHQVTVTLSDVVLSFRELPDAVTAIVIGVKAVQDEADSTITERGRYAVTDGCVSIPLDSADLVYSFGVTHYSIWFQALGGENGEGLSAGAVITLSGSMPGGASVSLSRSVRFGTNPVPTPTATTPPAPGVADADGDGVPDASDNCPAVPNPQQVATDPNSGCRLIDNNDGTVTDMNTGLMWEQTPTNLGQDWCAAQATCDGLVKAGYSDWRLASKAEWQALTGGTCNGCGDWKLPAGHPFSSVQPDYWTSTPTTATCPVGSGFAWTVYLYYGHAYYDNQVYCNYVWCVRG